MYLILLFFFSDVVVNVLRDSRFHLFPAINFVDYSAYICNCFSFPALREVYSLESGSTSYENPFMDRHVNKKLPKGDMAHFTVYIYSVQSSDKPTASATVTVCWPHHQDDKMIILLAVAIASILCESVSDILPTC